MTTNDESTATELPILYSSVRSPHCLKVSMFLHEKGIAFDRVEIDLPAKQQRTPEYLAISPGGHTPAYVDSLGTHIDSVVIMKHLEAVAPEPRLFPADAAELAEVDRWIARSNGPMRDVSHRLYWQVVETPEDGPDEGLVRDLMQRGIAEMHTVELALELSDSGWLSGSMSAADFAVFAWLGGYHRFGLPTEAEVLPRTMAWLERMRARPSYRASAGQKGRPFRPTK